MLFLANWFWLQRHPEIGAEKKLPRQIGLLALTILAALLIILVMPINDTTRGQILSLIGLVLTDWMRSCRRANENIVFLPAHCTASAR